MELREFIEAGATKAGSLTALGKVLDMCQPSMSSVKAHKRGLPIDLCIKLADYIGADRIAVISANELATEKKPEKIEFWSHLLAVVPNQSYIRHIRKWFMSQCRACLGLKRLPAVY